MLFGEIIYALGLAATHAATESLTTGYVASGTAPKMFLVGRSGLGPAGRWTGRAGT